MLRQMRYACVERGQIILSFFLMIHENVYRCLAQAYRKHRSFN